jgi:hypothetical protein
MLMASRRPIDPVTKRTLKNYCFVIHRTSTFVLANIQKYLSLLSMASSLFALIVAEVGLIPFLCGFGRVTDLLVGLGLLESAATGALDVCCVGVGFVGITCNRRVSGVTARRRAHLRFSAVVG